MSPPPAVPAQRQAWAAALWQPSLQRRVLLALLAAFVLVGGTLLARDFLEFKDHIRKRQALHSATRALVGTLDTADPQRAALIVQATERQYNALRREAGPPALDDMLLQLQQRDGALVYASATLQAQPLAWRDESLAEAQVGGRRYHAVARITPHWRVLVLEPALADSAVLPWMARGLVLPLLIAFPLVLLPLVLAVQRGLRPLRQVAERVAARDPADFSALHVDHAYAELRPIVGALNDLLAQARAGIARERAFVQDAAHELRTPLAVITAQAHALTAAADPTARAEAQAALEHAIRRASHLVHQLLTLAGLESGTPRLPEPVNLVETVRRILIDAAPRAAARRIEIELHTPECLPATLDVVAFHSVLENLLGNALAYGREGGQVQVSLGLEAKGAGTRIRLHVADDGPGIPANEQPRLFDRFHRGRDAAAPGAGLGLAIVAQAVRRLGGTVGLTPGLGGQGAGFVVHLPVFGEGGATPAA